MNETYGQKLLLKYGWKKGKGLGKFENGIAQPIKASYKFDSAGLGYDHGEEYSFNWWDHTFNTAANNLIVENSKTGVTVRKRGDFEVSLRKPTKKQKVETYGNFLKSETTCGGSLNDQHSTVEFVNERELDLSSRLSFQETFKACGGCTAHKAARHGLMLNGKLQRLEAQERRLLKRATHGSVKQSAEHVLEKGLRSEERVIGAHTNKKHKNTKH